MTAAPRRRSSAETASLFVTSLLRALRDSNDTLALLTAEEVTSVGRMPSILPMMQAHPEGRAILRDRPAISSATCDFDGLRALPADRLGHRYVAHLDANGLDPDALTAPMS